MAGVNRNWQRYARWLGFIILALHIVLVSIPRCEIVMTVLQHQWAQSVATHDADICHDAAASHDEKAPAFTSKRLCQCSVLSFMAFHAPVWNLHDHVYFRIQSERLLTFPWTHSSTQFHPLVEPPYPKA